MAASVAMQSFLGSPVAGVFSRRELNQVVRLSCGLHLPKRANFRVRSMAEQENDKETADAAPQPTQPNVARPNPAPKPKVSTKFEDVLAFSGPGPERINGRLAMIGFVAAIGVELGKGQDLFAQINDGGLLWFIGTSVLLSTASLIPLFRGVRAEAEGGGFMNSDAELWNGRFAMLGLIALAFTEYLKGGALV
ncbi:early light-induced protein 2, chloroplastic isoform X1 [Coffea eugenioides]|uniref:Early light-induced protein 2, chloroplastic-like isoform X1 n=1 Tax=Coffea arabica TaxID=13443 RepID=A0A6P6WVM7_COFAR|nr:early light-induced protein 2, chloroplastic isoform X1 [Coffea eugenioides]